MTRAEGMPDAWGDRAWLQERLHQELLTYLQSFGYQLIAVPIVEQTELYLRKSGEDLVAKMYDFTYQNRRLCLRPEFTASVIRSYLEHFPVGSYQRFCYGGAVFRYELQSNQRQFTQVGVELIGSSSLVADAEVIYTACASLSKLGINNFQLVIGHIGVLLGFLKQLNLHDRLISRLIAGMEQLQQADGKEGLLAELQANYGSDQSQGELAQMLAKMDEISAQSAVLEMLENLRIQIDGNRDPQEIARRLISKIKHQDHKGKITLALDFMAELVQLEGAPHAVLARGKKLLAKYHIPPQPLQELEQIMELLEVFNTELALPNDLTIDLGLTRGLQYYTGTIFELLDRQGNHLGGGGRYDDLVGTLGGKVPTPATGFSLNLDWLRELIYAQLPPDRPKGIVIKFAQPTDVNYGIKIAQQLRQQGLVVELALGEIDRPNQWQITIAGEAIQVFDPRQQVTHAVDYSHLITYLQNSHE